MIELLGGAAAILGVLLAAAIIFALTYCAERDDARVSLDDLRSDLAVAESAKDILNNRVTVLRMDVEERDLLIAELRKVNTELHRENGRLKAEAVAAKPKRGAGGKFVAKKPQPATVTPISGSKCSPEAKA